jgi:hypothetical protein
LRCKIRIKSDFKDYYDCVQATGQDQTLLYLRMRKEILLSKFPIIYSASRPSSGNFVHYTTQWIGFCGKFYPVVKIKKSDNYTHFRERREPFAPLESHKFCFNLEDIDTWVKDTFNEEEQEGYFHPQKVKWRDAWQHTERRSFFNHYFTSCKAEEDKHSDIFIEYSCPIVTFRSEYVLKKRTEEHYIVLNPCLKDYGFYRIFEPYQAFQEIAMFLGNMAEPRKEIPEIDDTTMAEAKGFDKYSFRKEPTRRRQ